MNEHTPDPVLSARGRLAIAVKCNRPQDAVVARRDLTAAVLDRAIRQALAASPALTREQRTAAARLLLSGGAR